MDPIARWRELDQQLVSAARKVHLLRRLSWSQATVADVQAAITAGRKITVAHQRRKVSTQVVAQLEDVLEQTAQEGDAVAVFLHRTARSYHTACELIAAAGQPLAGEHSKALYGDVDQPELVAAKTLLRLTNSFLASARDRPAPQLDSQALAELLTSTANAVFGPNQVAIKIDPKLSAKAAASSRRIRVRAESRFTQAEAEALVQHELLVHTLSGRNGHQQPLSALSLAAPRTTATQEGLAVFAELVTGTMGVVRLRRLALRVQAIDRVQQGESFARIVKFFADHGNELDESIYSAMRVFRGMPLTGGAAFTKDHVYLAGLLDVHKVFRDALAQGELPSCRWLFAGKLAAEDVALLRPLFDQGVLVAPEYLPAWFRSESTLAAYLALAVFATDASGI